MRILAIFWPECDSSCARQHAYFSVYASASSSTPFSWARRSGHATFLRRICISKMLTPARLTPNGRPVRGDAPRFVPARPRQTTLDEKSCSAPERQVFLFSALIEKLTAARISLPCVHSPMQQHWDGFGDFIMIAIAPCEKIVCCVRAFFATGHNATDHPLCAVM